MILISDSGSTKTDWAAITPQQTIHIQTQGINPCHQPPRQIADILTAELLPQLAGARAVTQVFFYGAGCTPAMSPVVQGALCHLFPQAGQVNVGSDMLGAARALCRHEAGVACILGTGSNSCLYDGRNITDNVPALGYILGDEGSGAVLGLRFLNALYKRRLPSSLLHAFQAEYGISQAQVIERVYRQPMANRFLASLSPFICEHLDDEGVQELVIGNFCDFFTHNVARYGTTAGCTSVASLPVHFVGSMGHHYHAQLLEAARRTGFTVGRILKSPIRGLVEYHGGDGAGE